VEALASRRHQLHRVDGLGADAALGVRHAVRMSVVYTRWVLKRDELAVDAESKKTGQIDPEKIMKRKKKKRSSQRKKK
jgi:hypothetical protein